MSKRMQERFSLSSLTHTLYCQGRRPIVPLIGYPGLQLTKTTIKQNQFNHIVQFQSLSRLYDRFQPDAMFFMMDLSVEASALGLAVRFPLEETPSVENHPVKTREDLEKFRKIDLLGDGRVWVFIETLHHMRSAFPCPVGAYVIGPLTLAGLMIGANELAMKSIIEPELFREAVEFSYQVVMKYAHALREAGADLIMVLEPTAVIFGPHQFRQNLSSLYREMVGIFDDIEIILHVCGDSTHLLKVMADTGVAGLSLDSMVDFKKAIEIVGPQVMLIGNVSPIEMLTANPNEIYIQTVELLDQTRNHPQFVLSTGCDLPQDVPLENIDAFIKAGKDWRQQPLIVERKAI